MERKLASIQKAIELVPIEGADVIELCRINGWQCVVKKGEFKAGDLGVFLEIDAIPPDTPTFSFLWQSKSSPNEILARPEKFRIRTMRLRGTLSQGLFLPLSSFDLGEVFEGQNVTELLGVQKYEPPIPAQASGEIKGIFPGFLPKTDEVRVQSEPGVLAELRGLPYVATLKCDGTSSSFLIDKRSGEFHVCGRNYSMQDGDNLYWMVVRKYGIEAILEANPNLAIQGEIVGPGIQKNRLGLKELELRVFNVYDLSANRYLDYLDARAFCERNGLPMVDEIERGEAFEETVESVLQKAEGKYPGTSNEREGLVFRPLREMRSQVLGGRLSFKAISNRFLLKEGE